MTRSPVALYAEDLTIFTRALSQQLGETGPSHLILMNMIARAAGFQNVQHLRSAHASVQRLKSRKDAPTGDARSVERALQRFDSTGRLRQWPSKRAVQTLALWALWATLPAGTIMREREINERLAQEHLFSDPATLRRTMISCGLLTRRADGTDYRRVEQEPSPEAKALIHVMSARRRGRSAIMMDQADA